MRIRGEASVQRAPGVGPRRRWKESGPSASDKRLGLGVSSRWGWGPSASE